MNGHPVRLLVVDDNSAVRHALVMRLAGSPALEVVGDTGDAEVALNSVNQEHPDVVILESKLRNGAALRFCQQALKASPPPKIVVLTSFASDNEQLNLAHLGINHYLMKDIDTEELIRVIRSLA